MEHASLDSVRTINIVHIRNLLLGGLLCEALFYEKGHLEPTDKDRRH